jgi:hypothetical protein
MASDAPPPGHVRLISGPDRLTGRRESLRFPLSILVGSFLSLFFLQALAWGSSGPSPYLQSGDAQTTEAALIHTHLAKLWERYKGFSNLDRAGFLQIYLDVLRERPLFPYFAGLHSTHDLRFVNYGQHGFFVGRRSADSRSVGAKRKAGQGSERSGPSSDPELSGVDGPGEPFEPLEWGAVYLTDEALKNPLFLRQHVIRTHSLARARRSFAALVSENIVSKPALREGFVLTWNGGLRCLARLQSRIDRESDAEVGLQCDQDIGRKLQELDDLEDDAQFFYLLSGQPSDQREKVCKASGILEERNIEGFGVISGTRARCILFRERVEDSWGLRSKVHCLNPVQNNHLWGNYDHVDFVFPTSSTEQFILVESRFDPPRLTEIDLVGSHASPLRSAGNVSDAGAPAHIGGGRASAAFSGLPRGDFGMYQCLTQQLGKTVGQLFFVPQDVYLGRRRVSVTEDTVYGYRPTRDRSIGSEVLSWEEMMRTYPSMDRFPEVSCAYGPSIDVKCGVRIVQSSAQVLQEEASGDLARAASSDVRKASLLVVHSLLDIIRSELGVWGLHNEVDLLSQYSEKRLKTMGVTLASPAVSRSSGSADGGEALSLSEQGISQDWRVYVSVSDSFWKMLAAEAEAGKDR